MLQRRYVLRLLGAAPLLLMVGCEREKSTLNLRVGDSLPALQLPKLDGSQFSFSAYSDSPVLLNFWATWCLPCRAEMAGLESAHKYFASGGLKIFGISVDSDVFLVKEFVFKEDITFPILLDPNGERSRTDFRVQAFPTSYLVDRSGRIADLWVGEVNWDASSVRKRIEQVL